MTKRPDIPHTKRSSYRPMNTMNGDFLTQLKRPLASEFGPEIRGTMRGRAANCKHKIQLWYKDKEYNLRKISRSEDSVYDAFLQIHKEKRKLVRNAYKRQQEEAREAAMLARERGLILVDKLVLNTENEALEIGEQGKNSTENLNVSHENIDTITPNIDHINESEIPANEHLSDKLHDPNMESVDNIDLLAPTGNLVTTTGEPPKHKPQTTAKTKVLQVSKSDPQNPLVGERKSSITDILVNKIDDDSKQSDDNHTTKKTKKKKTKQKAVTTDEAIESEHIDNGKQYIASKSPPQKPFSEIESVHHVNMKYKRSNFNNAMPSIDETESQSPELTMAYQKAWKSEPVSPHMLISQSTEPLIHSTKDNCPHLTSPKNKYKSRSLDEFDDQTQTSSGDTTSYDSQPVSLVLLNKKRTKYRDKLRKKILNSEPLILYMRDQNGDIIPSITEFKRKTFDAPSNKEKYFQKKMLKSQKDAKESQDDKIEKFFQKLDIDKDKENEYYRHRQARPPSAHEKLPPDLPNLGVSLEQMAAVFNRRHKPLPDQVEPSSIEAMQYCQYLRSYDLDEPKKTKRNAKTPQVF